MPAKIAIKTTMKLKTTFFYAILIFAIKANCQTNFAKKDTINVHTNSLIETIEKPIKVSIKDLMNSPKKYYGKWIQVYGYLKLEIQESLLFGSQESFESKNRKDAILFVESREDIYVMQQKCKNQYVLVTAKFGRTNSNEFIGGLYWIKSIDILR